MPKFDFQALTDGGDPVRGQTVAANKDEAVYKIRNKGLFPTDVRERSEPVPRAVAADSTNRGTRDTTTSKPPCLYIFVLGAGREPTQIEAQTLRRQFISRSKLDLDYSTAELITGSTNPWSDESKIGSAVTTHIQVFMMQKGIEFNPARIRYNHYYDPSNRGFVVAVYAFGLSEQRSDPRSHQRKTAVSDSSAATKCPSCGSVIPPRSALCVGCGYNFVTGTKLSTDVQAGAPPENASAESDSKRDCAYCGEPDSAGPFVYYRCRQMNKPALHQGVPDYTERMNYEKVKAYVCEGCARKLLRPIVAIAITVGGALVAAGCVGPFLSFSDPGFRSVIVFLSVAAILIGILLIVLGRICGAKPYWPMNLRTIEDALVEHTRSKLPDAPTQYRVWYDTYVTHRQYLSDYRESWYVG